MTYGGGACVHWVLDLLLVTVVGRAAGSWQWQRVACCVSRVFVCVKQFNVFACVCVVQSKVAVHTHVRENALPDFCPHSRAHKQHA